MYIGISGARWGVRHGGGGGGTGAYVQSKAAANTNYANTSATLTGAVGAGNALICLVANILGTSSETFTVADNKGNTWTQVGSVTQNRGFFQVFVAFGCAAGSTTVTASITAATTSGAGTNLYVMEVSGVTAVDASSLVPGSAGTSTDNTFTVTTTGTGRFLVGICEVVTGSTAPTVTNTSSWSAGVQFNETWWGSGMGSAYKLGTTSGAYSVTFHSSVGTSAGVGGALLALR